MRKKIVITIILIIFIIQTIMPAKVNAEPSNNELPTEQTGQNMGNNATQATSNSTVFDPDVTWDWVYEPKEYGLWVPSNAEMIENAPMIVWLHGAGEGESGTEEGLKKNGFSKLICNWKMEGFSAFILCPHTSHNGTNSWANNESPSRLAEIIDKVILQYPIDPTNVVIIGRSAGANGTASMAKSIPEYFSKVVLISLKNEGVSSISLPTVCYVEQIDDGGTYLSYMQKTLIPKFGAENCFIMEGTDHSTIVEKAFYDDSGQYMGIARKWTFRFDRMVV